MPQIAKRPFMAAVMRAERRFVKSFGAAQDFSAPQSGRDIAADCQVAGEFQPG
jgi:hypothetical protein